MPSTKELSDALRQLSKSTADMQFDIVTGEVMVAYPALCTYAVLPRGGSPIGELTIAVGMGGGSGRKSGSHGGDSYMPGTTVLVARARYPLEMKIHQYSRVFVGYIIGRAPEGPGTPDWFPPFDVTGNDLDYYVQKLTDAFTESQEVPDASQDLSFGVPADIFAGDWVKAGSLQNYMLLGSLYAGLGGSPLSKVECFGLLDKVRIVAETFERESAMLEEGYYQDRDSTAFYTRKALTLGEGLGAAGGTAPFTEGDENGFEKTETDQTGIFRHEVLGGKIGAGEWEMMAGPPLDSGIATWSGMAGKARQGMLSIRKYYNGIYRLRAAQEISFTKSLYVPVPSRLKPEDRAAFEKEDAESVPYRTTDRGQGYGDYYDEFGAELENYEVEWDNENADNCRLRARDAYWKLFTRSEIGERFPGVDLENAPRKLAGLDPEEFDYPMPSYCELLNAVTGLTERVYALESVLRLMPDGAVVLSDGHGSELRMARGRVSLGAASDLELRPGRDLIEMTPRTRVLNAGGDLYIQSARESVFLKSEKDLRLLAASSGKGLLLLESRADSDSDSELVHPDSLKRGVLIKSKSALAAMGRNSYYGVAPLSEGDAPEGYSRTKNGSITIDAAGGQLNMAAANAQLITKSGFLMATDSGLVSMSGATLGVVATSLQAAIGSTIFNGPESPSVVLQELAPEGVRATAHSIAAANPFISINGIVQVSRTLQVASMVQAGSFLGGTGYFVNASAHSGCRGGGGAPSVDVSKTSFAGAASISESIGEAVDPENTGITDKSMWYAGFAYPTTRQYRTAKVKMRALRWQLMLANGGAGETWEENPVEAPDGSQTFVWPGEEHWNGGSGFVKGADGAVPLYDYITNRTT